MAVKRRIYLINPRFQLKFSIYVCLILFISTIIYPLAIYDVMTNFMNYMAQQSPALSSSLADKRFSLLVILGLWQIGFLGLAFIICIFFSHKIAGPLFKLMKYLKNIREGGQRDHLFFRKGDYFPEVAEEFNQTFDALHETFKQDLVYLDEVNSYINNLSIVVPDDKKAVLREISAKISEIQGHYKSI